jgi:hypothetical protein
MYLKRGFVSPLFSYRKSQVFIYGLFIQLHLSKNIIMKKTLLLLFVCASSTHIIAQKSTTEKAEKPIQSAISANDIALPPPLPPEPPTAPPPPPPPQIEQVKFTPPVIVNDKGYNLSVHYYNGKNLVYMKRKGGTEKVSMDNWNANKSFYENKYGELPPPPPPPAPPVN